MRPRTLTLLGLACLIVGGVVLAGPTFGFTTVSADRWTSVNVADDQQNALLGIQSGGNVGTLRGDDPPKVVGNLTNNLDEDVDVIDFKIYNDSGTLAVDSPSPGTTIAVGSTEDVTVACAESTNLGQREIEIEIVEVDGATTSIQSASFNATVDIQCNKGGGSGFVNFQANDVNTTDTAQTFSFDGGGLKNNDEAYINLTDPQENGGVDYTGGSVGVVNGSGGVTYNSSTHRITYTASGNEKGTIELQISGIQVNGGSDDRYTVSYSEQRSSGNRENRDDSDIFYITDRG